MAFFKQILVGLLCLFFIPCTVTSDNDVDQRRIDVEHLLLQSMPETIVTLESMGLIVPWTYHREKRISHTLEISVWEVLNSLRSGYYYLWNANPGYMELGLRIQKVAVERDPEVAAGWRQYYASRGLLLPKIIDYGDVVEMWYPTPDGDYVIVEYE